MRRRDIREEEMWTLSETGLPHGKAIEEEQRQKARDEADDHGWTKTEESDKPNAVPNFCLLLHAH